MYGPTLMFYSCQDGLDGFPTHVIHHGHFVDEQYLHSPQIFNFGILRFRKIQLGLEVRIEIEQIMNGCGYHFRARYKMERNTFGMG